MVDSKVQREITILNLNGISHLVHVINCRTLETAYFLRRGMQMSGENILEPLEEFDSIQTAEVVAIYSSFTPGEMAPSSNSFTSVLMVITKSLKMFQCTAINVAP